MSGEAEINCDAIVFRENISGMSLRGFCLLTLCWCLFQSSWRSSSNQERNIMSSSTAVHTEQNSAYEMIDFPFAPCEDIIFNNLRKKKESICFLNYQALHPYTNPHDPLKHLSSKSNSIRTEIPFTLTFCSPIDGILFNVIHSHLLLLPCWLLGEVYYFILLQCNVVVVWW